MNVQSTTRERIPDELANKCREHLRAVLSWAWEEACSCNLENQEMPTIPVELPDHLQSYVDESAKRAGFANASEYIVALVADASEI
jgi:hypothetical protein